MVCPSGKSSNFLHDLTRSAGTVRSRDIPISLLIFRRRVIEEMQKPGPDGERRFASDRQLALFVGISTAHMSHVLHGQGEHARGVSWKVLDRFAKAFDCPVWELFWMPDVPFDGPRMPPKQIGNY